MSGSSTETMTGLSSSPTGGLSVVSVGASVPVPVSIGGAGPVLSAVSVADMPSLVLVLVLSGPVSSVVVVCSPLESLPLLANFACCSW